MWGNCQRWSHQLCQMLHPERQQCWSFRQECYPREKKDHCATATIQRTPVGMGSCRWSGRRQVVETEHSQVVEERYQCSVENEEQRKFQGMVGRWLLVELGRLLVQCGSAVGIGW